MTEAVAATENNTTEAVAVSVSEAQAEFLNNINIEHPLVFLVKSSFHFKKNDLGEKRPTLELQYPVPTVEGIVHALKDEKQRNYILDVLSNEVYKAVRSQLTDDNGSPAVNSQEALDMSKLTLEFLANVPAAERRGGGIAKETWEAFGKDYLAVMPAVTGKSADQIGNAVKLILAKFQPVKTNKQVLTFLKGQLALWATNTQNLEDFAECYEFLDKKIDTFLNMDEASLLANL